MKSSAWLPSFFILRLESFMVLSLFHFLLFAFSQIATPGPANMIMLATGAKYGFRNAVPFVFGVIIGKQIIIWPIGFAKTPQSKLESYRRRVARKNHVSTRSRNGRSYEWASWSENRIR